jgi:hypothetical protein
MFSFSLLNQLFTISKSLDNHQPGAALLVISVANAEERIENTGAQETALNGK